MAFRTRDVVEAMERASGQPLRELRVDGGASVDGLAVPVPGGPPRRPRRPCRDSAEATGLGAAMLAAVGEGLIDGPEAAAASWQPGRRFEPADPGRRPAERYAAWLGALERVRDTPGLAP